MFMMHPVLQGPLLMQTGEVSLTTFYKKKLSSGQKSILGFDFKSCWAQSSLPRQSMGSDMQPRAALGWLCTTAFLADLALPKQPVQGREQPKRESSCGEKGPHAQC